MRTEILNWSNKDWEALFENLLEHAEILLKSAPKKMSSVIVVKTSEDKTYSALIPDIQNWIEREKNESEFLQTLVDSNDTEVIFCVAVLPGKSIIIPSWNFRCKLLAINSNNSETEILLQGKDQWIVKQLKTTLPSPENTKERKSI